MVLLKETSCCVPLFSGIWSCIMDTILLETRVLDNLKLGPAVDYKTARMSQRVW